MISLKVLERFQGKGLPQGAIPRLPNAKKVPHPLQDAVNSNIQYMEDVSLGSVSITEWFPLVCVLKAYGTVLGADFKVIIYL